MHAVRWRWILSVVWLMVVAFSVKFNFGQVDKAAFEMAVTEGRTSWIKDQAYRQWVTEKGGIYAPPSAKYPPHPYLAHIPDRDVVTTGGKRLTLINPAYMIRQVHEISVLPEGPHEHITSLKPLRPENRPDAWEAAALREFENGKKEIAELAEANGTTQMRFMRPMVTKEGCLKCHGIQGYKVGDIRGGVSFSIPYTPFQDAADTQKQSLLFWHIVIAGIGLLGIMIAFHRIERNERQLHSVLDELEERVRDNVDKIRQQDLLLIQQSRLASMGEMIHNIAHQWRQPLNTLAVILANIQDDFKYNELTAERLDTAVGKSRTILESMSTTIDDFRDFFRPDKEAKVFDIAETIDDSLVILAASLENNHIVVEKEYARPLTCYGYPNQFSQVILNILTNAKDAIKLHQITQGIIRIHTSSETGSVVISISDNGGGIDEAILPKVFDPYFTTKESGSGIGLYMAQMIIERNHNGTIEAQNIEGGARFVIRIPTNDHRASQKGWE